MAGDIAGFYGVVRPIGARVPVATVENRLTAI
jgi:hypothetical protein